jgi:uncharacterized protein YuzE
LPIFIHFDFQGNIIGIEAEEEKKKRTKLGYLILKRRK